MPAAAGAAVFLAPLGHRVPQTDALPDLASVLHARPDLGVLLLLGHAAHGVDDSVVDYLQELAAGALIEFIRLDEHGARALAQGGARGIDRVAEALQTHMWPSMVMSEASSRQAPKLPSTPDADTEPLSVHPERAAIDALTATLFSAFDLAGEKPASQAAEAGAEQTDDAEFAAYEAQADSIEAALQRFATMRQEMAGLPDNERKDMAAEIALSFLEQMGGDDGDDEVPDCAQQ